jgi:hypothetical protein
MPEEEKKYQRKGIIFTFSMKSARVSNSEKTKFFKELYGWTQTVPGGKKKYVYHREGVLEDVPHEKVDQSSFLVPEDNADELMEFFDEWSKKVMFRTFKVMLDNDMFKELQGFRRKKFEEEEEV